LFHLFSISDFFTLSTEEQNPEKIRKKEGKPEIPGSKNNGRLGEYPMFFNFRPVDLPVITGANSG
jgi:hypothetical protein